MNTNTVTPNASAGKGSQRKPVGFLENGEDVRDWQRAVSEGWHLTEMNIEPHIERFRKKRSIQTR